jgi:hypothetical protein
MTYANANERQALISGLRELASFLEGNPDAPAPAYTDLLVSRPVLPTTRKSVKST